MLKRWMVCFLVAAISVQVAQAQQPIQKGWHLLDEEQDGYYGISLQKAYDFLQGRKSQQVIVAVIDSGIDTTHEDLKPIIWRNTKDNNANGIDDDKNGYPDDALGWNFLGNRKGENVEKESAEAARLFHALAPQFDNRQIDSNLLSPEARADFRLWLQVQKAVAVTEEDRFMLKILNATSRTMLQYDSIIAAQWGKHEFTPIELETFIPQSPEARKAKLNLLRIYTLLQVEPEQTNVEFMEGMREFIQQKEDIIYLREKPTTNYRLQITSDDENNWQSRNYGNADVMAGTAMHGTHVAGIIAAVRNNGLGIDGIADNVRILPLRVVPNGDEHDKDVALAIRYAVDQGASIINMSFGKGLSPQKHWVDEAIAYAASKNVLLVHAAGNDATFIDTVPQYPTPFLNNGTKAPNFITVGASSDNSIKGGLIADFTNYGPQTVDVMAPGVKIYATVPTGNKYAFLQGTSMAAPVVSGIAAMLLSYFPQLTAVEVKQVIEQSVDTRYSDRAYPKPGGEKKETLTLREACKTGGVVNAYNAVQLAAQLIESKHNSKSVTSSKQ
ncbi:S8 family serine peptidase [Phnomibacter sp. MR]|uniref:S8 family serine peptidase n=1 Tax=Phnomibacter sp. MR TaxID=3042318 RepID=UPI003A811538